MARVKETRVISRDVPDEALDAQDRRGEEREEPKPESVATGSSPTMAIPLLPNIASEDIGKVSELAIWRTSPSPGFLGPAEVTMTLTDLKDRFGGKRINVRATSTSHKFIKGASETYDIAAPPKDPDKDLDKGEPRGNDSGLAELVLEGMHDIKSSVASRRGDDNNSLISLAFARSDTERKLADVQMEGIKLQLEQAKLNLEVEKARIAADADFRKHEIETRLAAEREKIAFQEKQLAQERKDAADKLEREIKEERERRKDDMEKFRQEQAAKEERDRKYLESLTEREQKFQALMMSIGSKSDATGTMLQVLQMGMEIANDAKGGKEEDGDPMSKIVGHIPDVLNMLFASKQVAPTPQRPALPANGSTQPSTQITLRGGTRMANKPTPGKVAPTNGTKPPWVNFLKIALQYFTVDLIGDAINQLNEGGAISDKVMNLIKTANEDIAKVYMKGLDWTFAAPDVWAKIQEVRSYIVDPEKWAEENSDEDEEEKPNELGLNSGEQAEEAAEEKPAEGEKVDSGVKI